MRKQVREHLLNNVRGIDQRYQAIAAELAKLKAKEQKLEIELSELQGRKLRADELSEQGDTPALDACPDCYLDGHKNQRLEPIPSDTNDDLFRCRRCGLELLVPSSI